jgi:hypothetical protein
MAVRLPNGHTLIVDGLNQRVIEVTAAGETVWTADGIAGATHARRLQDGATLITYSGGHFLVEIGEGGDVLWRAGLAKDS